MTPERPDFPLPVDGEADPNFERAPFFDLTPEEIAEILQRDEDRRSAQ